MKQKKKKRNRHLIRTVTVTKKSRCYQKYRWYPYRTVALKVNEKFVADMSVSKTVSNWLYSDDDTSTENNMYVD